MADTADTADTMANTANILARFRREADATFSRSGSKFSRGKSGKYRNWGGRNWSGGNWSGDCGERRLLERRRTAEVIRHWNGYPYWGWRYPYSYCLQLLSLLVFVRVRQLLRIKTAILSALTHRRPRQDGGSVV